MYQKLLTGGDAAVDGAQLSLELFLGHLQDLDAQNDALDLINQSNDTAGNNTEDNSLDAQARLALNEARNTVAIEQNGQNAESSLIHNNLSLYFFG